jgi:hypothetical protein
VISRSRPVSPSTPRKEQSKRGDGAITSSSMLTRRFVTIIAIVGAWCLISWLLTTQIVFDIQFVEDFLINEKVQSPDTEWNKQKLTLPAVKHGKIVMSTSNVTLLGVGRDLGDGLPEVLRQVLKH